jgi:two-component system, cell cycle sensor histidine kinase and response regulator CckA
MADSLQLFLVEDDDDIALLITKILERAGHQVTRCRNAADALIVLGHSSFDLVLLDHRLPDMAGLDLLEALGREGITTPALMVTAYGDQELATRVLRAGALDYVVKDPGLAFLTELPKRVQESVTRHRLQHTNRLLIEALESARDGIMITDLQGIILHVNRALERMSGYTRQELIGQNPRMLKNSPNPPELYADLWRTILGRSSWQGELTNRRKDGSLNDVSLTVSPIVDSQGKMTHFVGILRDITERRFLERQLLQAQKMQSVGTLAGGVAHEFNNLLAGISGYAALGLREPGVAPPVREFLQHIVTLSERCASLTRQMLAFARKPTLVRRPTRIGELVTSTADLARHSLRTEVVVEIVPPQSETSELLVEADANQLQQALINLALNARDAGRDSSPITFRLARAVLRRSEAAFPENVPPGDYVLLEVGDRGCGMTTEVLNQALDPFFTTKPVGQGTGLGLPVVFGIVRAHQGYLTIDSEPGRGTSIGLYLPRLTPPAAPVEQPDFEAGEVLEPENVVGRKILVVDDEEAVLDVVRRFLEIAGHQVTCAANSGEAIRQLEGGLHADLVILDVLLPREDGGLFRTLRECWPHLPVLLCTGLLASEPPPEMLEAGPVSMIRKPFRMNELWYAVNRALAGDTVR